MVCAGVDVGGTTAKIGIFTSEGELKKKWEVPTGKEKSYEEIINNIADSLKKEFEIMKIPMNQVEGIGIGVPGPILPGNYVEICVNLGWHNVYPAKDMQKRLSGIKVVLGNDANIAALGETWQGGAKGYSDVMLLTLGTGVGGGLVIGGNIINGVHGLAGEIGHIHVRDEETNVCNCGGKGCLEQICSATGIVREAKRVLEKYDTPSIMRERQDSLSAKVVTDTAKAGDELAIKVMDTFGRYLGLALSHAALIVDPEVFVIGGGVSKAGDYLIKVVEKYYDYYTALSKNHGSIVLAKLGNDAGIYGAARLAMN